MLVDMVLRMDGGEVGGCAEVDDEERMDDEAGRTVLFL